jgi:hypothetical protein
MSTIMLLIAAMVAAMSWEWRDGLSMARAEGPSDALVQLADLPPGWAVMVDEGAPGSGPCGRERPTTSELGLVPLAEAEARYERGYTLLGHSVIQFATADDAAAVLAAWREVVGERCEWRTDQSINAFRPISWEELGDETDAYVLTIEAELPARGYWVITRVGATVSSLRVLAVAPGVIGMSDEAMIDLLMRLARIIADRLVITGATRTAAS